MKRKNFLKRGIIGLSSILILPSMLSSCNDNEPIVDANDCVVSPSETDGPFPIKTPADLIRENIVGDRTGIPLLIHIKVENTNNNCKPLPGVWVDIWHCDAQGNYSEYSEQLDGNFTNQHFLRGRQLTNSNGVASFLSIYPGWYPGRAPHLHLEVKTTTDKSLLITQTAFPEDVSNTVYATTAYKGTFDTSNGDDYEFGSSLNRNLATAVTGNITDGYTLMETIKVAG